MIFVTEERAETRIRVDGWLAGDGVAELERVLDAAAAPRRLVLDDLRGADEAGLAVLRRLAGQGTPLDGLSQYIQLMLANAARTEPFDALSPTHPETLLRSNRT